MALDVAAWLPHFRQFSADTAQEGLCAVQKHLSLERERLKSLLKKYLLSDFFSTRDWVKKQGMRGDENKQASMFGYVTMEEMIPAAHPLRMVRQLVDVALGQMEPVLAGMYAERGRPSIAPERLLRAQLLLVLYSIRSEGQLIEQLRYNFLYRWFVGLEMNERVWETSVFSKNRERLIAAEASQQLLLAVVEQARAQQLLSEEHFTVDGTLIQAWASRQSFKPRQDAPQRGTGARGRKLLRDTHESTTDPEARLFRKSWSTAALPSYLGHVITENRHGLIVVAMASQAGNAAEREAALEMLKRLKRRGPITLGADKSYQQEVFVRGLREAGVRPHVAEHAPSPYWQNWLSEDERNDPGLTLSQKKRRLVEKVFGWLKQDRIRQVKLRGLRRVDWLFQLTAAAHNLLRLSRLIPIPALA